MTGETGSAREEAERLVAAVLAMAAGRGQDENPGGTGAKLRDGLGNLGDALTGMVNQFAGAPGGQDSTQGPAGRHTTYGWSTGSLECCVCPVCRLISSMRDPNPHAAERLATGAGDFAMGVASLMRGLSAVTSAAKPSAGKPSAGRPSAGPAARPSPPPTPDPDTAWAAATRTAGEPGPEPTPDEDESPWAAATRAEARQAAEVREAARLAAEAGRAAEAREATDGPAAVREGAPSPAPAGPGAAPRAGHDVWAAATSAGAGAMADRDQVEHDDAGDEAPGRG